MTAFSVSTDFDDNGTIVSVEGEIDIASTPELKAMLDSVAMTKPERVVVDLSLVEFLDSTGLGVLVSAFKSFTDDGVGFRIVASDRRVLRVFEVTGLLDVFEVFETRSTALQ
ncbi:MAG: STAS domain-containing protein [Acidimicrobiales bacterium]